MKFKHKGKISLINFFNGKGFYLVAALSLIAIGAATWTAISSLGDISSADFGDSTSSNQYSNFAELDTDNTSSKEESSSSLPKVDKTSSKTPTSSKQETVQNANAVADFFIMPVSGGEVLKGYSETELQFSHTYSDFRIHKALDIKAVKDTPVYSCGKGTVTKIENDPLLGTVITIDHGNKITAKYCGLNENVAVKESDTVDSSMIIGTVSAIPSESVEQEHLHLEFYKDGKLVSPESFLTQ